VQQKHPISWQKRTYVGNGHYRGKCYLQKYFFTKNYHKYCRVWHNRNFFISTKLRICTYSTPKRGPYKSPQILIITQWRRSAMVKR
jgi:hypothetical protein